MLPDSEQFGHCSPAYFKALCDATRLTQLEIARRLGVSPRAIRYYLAGEREIKYPVQLALEQLEKGINE